MPKKYAGNQWRHIIFTNLRKRNKNEHENIRDLILIHNRLFDQSEALRFEAKQLSFQNEKLREELTHSQESRTSHGTSPITCSTVTGSSSVIVQQLEQKVYKLQEEVTDLLRHKGENVQQLIELNQCLQEKDKEIAHNEHKLADKETELMLARETIAAKDAKLQDAEAMNQFLRDECQTFILNCNALEETNRKLKGEMEELIQRWLALKAKDAERKNEEVEADRRRRQEIVEKNLEEASLEPRVVIEEDKFSTFSPVFISSSLPSKSYLTFDAHEGEVNALMFSYQGRLLASGGSDRRIKLWDVNHGSVDLKGLLSGSNAGVNAIDFDADESLLLGASSDYACRVWSTCDLRLRHTLTGHSGKVMACKFLSESSKVVTGSHDRTLKIWDLRSRSCTKTLFPGSICNDVAVSDSQVMTVVSGHFDKTVRFWDIRTETARSTITLQGKVTSLSLSKDGLYLLCSVRDDTLRIIDLRENAVCKTLTKEGFHLGADYSRAIFSPDGAYAACGCNSGAFYIWSITKEEVERELMEHSSCVLAASWNPNGRIVATCDKTKKIKIWGDF